MNKLEWDCVYWCHTSAWSNLTAGERRYYDRLYSEALKVDEEKAERVANLGMDAGKS